VSPLLLDLLAAALAIAMLVRNGPRLPRLRGAREERAGGWIAAVNVALAVAVLAYAVKGLVARLI
jgi:hypothetical protein